AHAARGADQPARPGGVSMASTTHLASPEDDRRHRPGTGALPLWSESYWFPLYDPVSEIGGVLRAGMYMKRGDANLYLFVTHKGAIVHAIAEHRAPAPPLDGDAFTVAGLRLDIEQPLERFRLRYDAGPTAFDLRWNATSPAYKYPTPPSDEFPGHIEQDRHGHARRGRPSLRRRRAPRPLVGRRAGLGQVPPLDLPLGRVRSRFLVQRGAHRPGRPARHPYRLPMGRPGAPRPPAARDRAT